MPSRLACWIGRHTWVKRVEEGESYSVCDTCGKEREERRDRWGDAPGTGVGGDYPPLLAVAATAAAAAAVRRTPALSTANADEGART